MVFANASGASAAGGAQPGAALAVISIAASENPGNGNGSINLGEGALLNITLVNTGGVDATAISATLTPTTSGITMRLPNTSAYPNIPPSATGTNATPFLFTVAPNAPCPLVASFDLTVTLTGGSSPQVIPVQVLIAPQFTITTTLDGTAPAVSTGVTTATGVQTGRLNLDAIGASCVVSKPTPGLIAGGSRQFDSYTFTTCAENTGGCASGSLSSANGTNLFTAAYRLLTNGAGPSYFPADPRVNHRSDPGTTGPAVSYGGIVPTGSSSVVPPTTVVVHELEPGSAAGSAYTLTVSGLCAGACATPNQVPVARAKNVRVPITPPAASANASIDDGSSDPDGDTLTFIQSPPGPYPLGATTNVQLTVVDPKGAASQASATVTVVSALPTITITSPTSAPTLVTTATSIDLAGTASDDVAVTQVTWSNSRGGSGVANGTTSWSVPGIAILPGDNVITVTAFDGDSSTTTDVITVTILPEMALSAARLNFGAVNNGGPLSPVTPAQTIVLTQAAPATVTWTVSASQPWIQVTPASGTGGATLTVSIVNPPSPNQLPFIGSLTGTITVNTTGALNSPAATINLTLLTSGQLTAPAGSFDTPTDGLNNVTGSIPVTGWTIDDIGSVRVEIYRDGVGAEGTGQVFIGNAVFVTGARTDISGIYPTKPYTDQAGWGYLLLTNFLPNQGNGIYRLHAYAVDVEGRRTLLGSKTITCTNATATTPFGSIDTPDQGGTASGSAYINFGWALAGQKTGRFIPTDGSTIQVYIDSAPIGTVDSYNNPRADIQTLFPGYVNTDGAVGIKTINTTQLANGVHTIAWIVSDNLGAASGVGSRFFVVSNSAGSPLTGSPATSRITSRFGSTVIDATSFAEGHAASLAAVESSDIGVAVRHGFDPGALPEMVMPDSGGVRRVRTSQLDRLVIDVAPFEETGVTYRGFVIDGDLLRGLPTGSQFDAATGRFQWAPALAFGGTHQLAFVRESQGARRLIRIDVTIDAQRSGAREPRLVIDTPSADASVDGRFSIAGWAFDPNGPVKGPGIDTLHVWAYPVAPDRDSVRLRAADPIWVGVAAYGGLRPDVAAHFGARYLASGYGIDASLPPGTYDVVVYAHSMATLSFTIARTVRVTVR